MFREPEVAELRAGEALQIARAAPDAVQPRLRDLPDLDVMELTHELLAVDDALDPSAAQRVDDLVLSVRPVLQLFIVCRARRRGLQGGVVVARRDGLHVPVCVLLVVMRAIELLNVCANIHGCCGCARSSRS